MTLNTNLNNAVDLMIEYKLKEYEKSIDEKFEKLEKTFVIANRPPNHEILQQKEVFEMLGIGRKRLKNWVARGLNEIRVDNRVYYRYSEIMEFIENN